MTDLPDSRPDVSPDVRLGPALGAPAIGTAAPDFELLDQHGTPVRLSSFRGHRAVLGVFFPWAFSGICGGELRALRDDLTSFQNDQVALVTISVDSIFTQRTFADAEGFEFPLLADSWPHGEIARRYGVFDETTGVALRGSFIVDTDGILRWSVVHSLGKARDIQLYREAIASTVTRSTSSAEIDAGADAGAGATTSVG